MEKIQEIFECKTALEKDYKKFIEKGNKTAAIRIRKLLQDIKNKSHQLRKDIQVHKKTLKPKFKRAVIQ
ncbi:MAG: histone H1 [Solitalea-like symbiont of Acarus siro]